MLIRNTNEGIGDGGQGSRGAGRADSFPKRVKIARANPQLRPKILASSVRNT
jgi:hypothetical protein